MTIRAKRVTLLIGMGALVAMAAGVIVVPVTHAAPKGSLEFTITTNEKLVMFGSTGTFHAKGAIKNSGRAEGYDWYPDLELLGDHGTMLITTTMVIPPGEQGRTTYGTFVIVDADGQYEKLIGVTGTVKQHLTGGGRNIGPVTAGAQRSGSSHGIQRTLEGSVPE